MSRETTQADIDSFAYQQIDELSGHEEYKDYKKTLPLHPLINPNAKHYRAGKGETSLETIEKKYTVIQAIAWCLITIDKYELRKDHKGQKESDEFKIKTYQDYYVELMELSNAGLAHTKVMDAWDRSHKHWRYRP